ncbi:MULTISPECIES: DUF397 domain-containing protein [Actinomadura]|uniref:DUF397 domain-containing protein n=1 Tax=Actinomadura yumaensis TaxID=111807 RepID=A0ABW2CR42_9ACTN|nr:DUF397 domain-containing protein [Actinomadura sp. J1-007]MWK36238.1 DUF397 domain-containing protein [Actinomadura sp. J1-007]
MNHFTPQWRKSSYSGQEGSSDCVQLAALWRKSSYSGEEGSSTCVEVAALWRKSSRSGSEGSSTCVEVAELAGVVGVRDSKDPDGGHLHVTAAGFAELVGRIKGGELG